MSCAAPVARGYFQAGQLYMADQLPLEPWFGWEVKRRERPLDWKSRIELAFCVGHTRQAVWMRWKSKGLDCCFQSTGMGEPMG